MSRHLSQHEYEVLWDAQHRYEARRTARAVCTVLTAFLFIGACLTGLWVPVIVLAALTMGGSCLGAFVRGIIGLIAYNVTRLITLFRHHPTAKVLALMVFLSAMGGTGCASQMYGLSCAMGYVPTTPEGQPLCHQPNREARR